MPLLLAIDQSTSASKALLLDMNRRVLARESIEHEQSYPQPGFVEQDAEEIFRNTVQACKKVLKEADNEEIAFLSISNQRETVVVFERATGSPLYPAMVWQCRRGTEECERLSRNGLNLEIHNKTGLKPDPYFSASKLGWLMENDRSIAAKLESGEALIGTIDTFLIYRLTKGKVFATDHTNASRTLLYNIKTGNWDESLCRIWNIPVRALAEIRDCSDSFGTCELEGHSIEIRGVMGDSHASLFSQRCFAPGTAKVTLGTGSSMLMNIGNEITLSDSGVLTTVAWSHAGKVTYAFEGIIISSASTLSWLKNKLGILEDVSMAETLATELENNEGVYLVPAFSGLGLPYWAPRARASISGLGFDSDRRHLARAALEAIAYQLKAALDSMNAASSSSLKRIQMDGGPTANRFLMQFIADLLRIPVNVSKMADGSALGSAMMGMLGGSLVKSLSAFEQSESEDLTYRPEMPEEEAKALYAGWENAIHQLLSEDL